MTLERLISDGASKMGIALPEKACENFRTYYDLLDVRSKEFNLTAIKSEEDAAKLHFLDSVGILPFYDLSGKKVIDIGTGAGFPGYPLKMAEPSLKITLVDSTEKKVNFLREVSEKTGVEALCIHARAEDLGQDDDHREKYDIAVSRAVAKLNILSELCLPLVKPGGVFIALKSLDSDEELSEAQKAIAALGGGDVRIEEYPIPGTDIVRRAVIVKKLKATSSKYPRRFSVIKKSPL